MADLAELGFRIDSQPAVAAASNLDKMTAASGRAEAGAEKVAKATDKAASASKRMSDEFNQSAKALGILAGVATGAAAAFAALVVRQINAADSLYTLSKQLGTTAEFLSTMQALAKTTGADVGALGKQFDTLQNKMAQAAGGNKLSAATFDAIGIKVRDANGNLKDLSSIVPEVATKFATYRDGAEKTALATRLFGEDAKQLIPLLNELGEKGLDGVTAAAKRMGLVISTQTAQAAHEFSDQMQVLKLVTTGFVNDVAKDVLPNLVALGKELSGRSLQLRDVAGGTTLFGDAIRSMTKFLIDSYAAIQKAAVYIAYLDQTISSLVSNITNTLGSGAWWSAMGKAISGNTALVAQGISELGVIGDQNIAKYAQQSAILSKVLADSLADIDKAAEQRNATLTKSSITFRGVMNSVIDLWTNADKKATGATAPVIKYGRALESAAKPAETLADAQLKLANLLDSIAGKTGPAAQAQSDYDKGVRKLAASIGEILALGGDYITTMELWRKGEADLSLTLAETTAELAKQRDVAKIVLDQLEKDAAVAGMTDRQRFMAKAIEDVTTKFAALSKEDQARLPLEQQLTDEWIKRTGAIYDAGKATSDLQTILSQAESADPFASLAKSIKDVAEQLEKISDKNLLGDAFDPEKVRVLQNYLGQLKQEQLEGYVGALKDSLSSLQTLAKDGSKEYKALQVAQSALNVVQAIGAVLNQGNGEPYSAFARMAAMAALVASIGAAVGTANGAAGGFSGGAAQAQATQGTGSVLGDSTAKSDSITKAVEATASATKELVGINRGMLRALQQVQAGLTGASTLLAGGAGDAEFAPVGAAQASTFGRLGGFAANLLFGGGMFGELFDKISAALVGAKKKVTDLGIRILGGSLSELLTNISVGAYQQVSSRSWFFGSTHTSTNVKPLGDDLAKQFQLVLDSIADTVREGAKALGLDMDAVNTAIAQYRIAEIKISTKGLSAEETQKELEAVFSKIFDGLAGAIVPFIGQFQKVGEGLGETLVRVATEVQVMQEAVKQLGFALNETDPEQFAIASDGLIELAGGLEQFISDMGTFLDAFASDAHKFDVAQQALNSAFTDANLVIPDTRDGMWDLMQSLDATTESGREQIATLLRLAGTADAYYTELEKRQEAINGILDGNANNLATAGMSQYQKAMFDLDKQFADQRATLEANGATVLQLKTLEEQYGAAQALLAAQFRKQIDDLLAANDWTLALAGLSDYERQVAQINQSFDAQYATLVGLGAAQADLDRLEKQRIATLHNLATATAAAAAAQAAANHATIAGIIGDNYSDLRQGGMTEYERQIYQINKKFAEQTATLVKLGATQAELDTIERQRLLTLGQLAEAMHRQVTDLLSANDWTLALAGMSDYDRQIAQINKAFDDQRATLVSYGATQQELDRLEQQRIATLNNLASATAAANAAQAAATAHANGEQIAGIIGQNYSSLRQAGMSDYERQVYQVNRDFAGQTATLVALGASQAQLDVIERQRVATLAQLAQANATQLAAEQAQRRLQIADLLGSNAWDLALAGMSEYERQVAQVNKSYDDQRATLIGLGATQRDLLMLERQRAEALGNLSAAQAAQLAADQAQAAQSYAALSLSLRNMGITLTDYEKSINEANNWYKETVAELDRLAIAAGRTGAETYDLANAERELQRRRTDAMNALMEQTQQLVTTLYGTNLSREIARLQKLLEGRDGWGASGEIDFSFYQQQRDLAAAQAQQAEQQAKLERLTGINSLVANLGQLLNIPGQSLEGLAKQFELPLDQFASDLGISQGKLEEYIRQQAERANAILTVNDTILSTGGLTNRLLRDIRDQTTLADASESRQVTGSFSTSGNVTSIGRTDRITARQAPEIRVRVDSADTAKQVASSERNAETSKLILKVLLENLPELRLSAEESVDEFREWRKSQRDNRYNNRKQA